MNLSPARPKANILIVDDDPTSLVLLRDIFDEVYSIAIATNGSDALLLAEDKPDLILLDINLPDMDGFAVCQAIKDNPQLSNIPIIFITSTLDSLTEEKGISIGAVDFITKPYSAPVLKARVRTHIELKNKTDQLETLVLKDPLTNISNRRHFDKMIQNEWGRLAREKRPLSIMMVDIDYFKRINDNFGHQVGDDCLRCVAEVLSESMQRPADIVARYGGEEFIILLPNTEITGALSLAEEIRKKTAEMHKVKLISYPLPALTISIGCAAVVPDLESSPADLIKSADKALYYAKANGRNQVFSEIGTKL